MTPCAVTSITSQESLCLMPTGQPLPAAPDTAKDAARLLHEALEMTTFQMQACYSPLDSATVEILNENRALLERYRWTRGVAAPR